MSSRLPRTLGIRKSVTAPQTFPSVPPRWVDGKLGRKKGCSRITNFGVDCSHYANYDAWEGEFPKEYPVRVISKARLRQFWQSPAREDAEGPLRAWYTHVNHKTVAW